MIIVSEKEFRQVFEKKLAGTKAGAVTGPGRSGAIAAVYASYFLEIPFIPYGQKCPDTLTPLLIVDTTRKTGKTLRRAEKKYPGSTSIYAFDEPPRVHFWYEKLNGCKNV